MFQRHNAELTCLCLSLLLSAVPGAPSLSVRPGSESSVVVRWGPPSRGSDSGPGAKGSEIQIQGYQLQFGLKNATLDTMVEFSARERTYTLTDVIPGLTYVVTLSAKSRSGYGDESWEELEMPEYPPRGYPQILESVNATCCSLQFSWLPPVPSERNGVITEYTVAYREEGGLDPMGIDPLSPPRQITLPASESSYTILGLNHSTGYEVQMCAHTSVGPGPFSPPLLYRTLAFETGRAGLGPVHRAQEKPPYSL